MTVVNGENFNQLLVRDFINIGGNMKLIDMVALFKEVVANNVPKDKALEDFTGGYIQQMSNSNQLVMYFGYKKKTNDDGVVEPTKNRATSIVNIPAEELDIFYVGLKAMVTHMRINKHSGKHKTESMLERMSKSNFVEVDSPKELSMEIDDDSVSENTLCKTCNLEFDSNGITEDGCTHDDCVNQFAVGRHKK